mgnify:FL=1
MNDKKKLRYEEYVPFAPDGPDETVNIHHCRRERRNDKLYITRKSDGTILAHCFHCERSGRYSDADDKHNGKKRVIRPKRRKTALKRMPQGGSTSLSKWSPEAKAWVSRAHLKQHDINQYGLTFYTDDNYVLLPVYSGATLCRVIRRSFGDTKYPKYYTVMHDNFSNGDGYIIKCRTGDSNVVVFVEDLLSAIRCAEWVDAVSLFGTMLNDNVLSATLDKKPGYKKRIVFLDNDNVNVMKAQRRIQRRLDDVFDHKGTLVYRTAKDPKNYNSTELRSILTGAH